MAVIALTSAKGAPGVTTTALALTALWPRTAILLEADMSGSSSILAGYLRASTTHTRGLLGLALAHRQRPIHVDDLWDQTIPLGPADKHLVPGIADPVQAAGLTSMWGFLAEILTALERDGVDVIIDAGRMGAAHTPPTLLRAADMVLLVTGSRLPDIAATKPRHAALLTDLETAGTGSDAVKVVVVGPATVGERTHRYPLREISAALQTPAAQVAWDPDSAQVYSDGATRSSRRHASAPLTRSMTTLIADVAGAITARLTRLNPPSAALGAVTAGRDDA